MNTVVTRESRAQQAGGVVAAGLLAIGQHMADHHLPPPFDIRVDAFGGAVSINVALYGFTAQIWLDSFIDVEVTDERAHPSGTVTTSYRVTLPESCTRVDVRVHRQHQAPLSVVDRVPA